jgi:hypothetical protein
MALSFIVVLVPLAVCDTPGMTTVWFGGIAAKDVKGTSGTLGPPPPPPPPAPPTQAPSALIKKMGKAATRKYIDMEISCFKAMRRG